MTASAVEIFVLSGLRVMLADILYGAHAAHTFSITMISTAGGFLTDEPIDPDSGTASRRSYMLIWQRLCLTHIGWRTYAEGESRILPCWTRREVLCAKVIASTWPQEKEGSVQRYVSSWFIARLRASSPSTIVTVGVTSRG